VINNISTVIEIAAENDSSDKSTNKKIEKKQHDIQKNDLKNIFAPFLHLINL